MYREREMYRTIYTSIDIYIYIYTHIYYIFPGGSPPRWRSARPCPPRGARRGVPVTRLLILL